MSWNTTSGQNVTFGLSDGSPAADDLSATGAMMVSLSSDHTQLSIVGPSGIGFWLDGTWEDSLSSDGNLFQHSFRPAPNSSVILHTGSILGEIPLPRAAVAGMKITTKAEPWKDPVGEYEHVEFGSGFLPLNTEDTSASNPIATLGKQYGLDINIPTVNWGLALGSDVMAQKSLASAPLNSAVPYFFFVDNNKIQGTFGSFSISVGGPSSSSAFPPWQRSACPSRCGSVTRAEPTAPPRSTSTSTRPPA